MEFELGYGSSQHKLIIMPKSRSVIITYAAKPQLSGVYIPIHPRPGDGSLKRPFVELVEYVIKGDFMDFGDGIVKRKLRTRVNFYASTPRLMHICFYRWSDPCDQTFVAFLKVTDVYTAGLRLVQREIYSPPSANCPLRKPEFPA